MAQLDLLPSAYLYLLGMDDPCLAWEYLRRNGGYRLTWNERSANPSGSAEPWGLRFP